MREIEQIYATHCTYHSSALERRDGDTRVLGYSARASTLSREELRRRYRSIERFLYYYLPPDVPVDQKPNLTPQGDFKDGGAPQRLFFCPSLAGVQVLGQVSYRARDCAQRVGSYFAHVLTSEIAPQEAPWSILECLQLWGASGWMNADDERFPWELPNRLQQLADLRAPVSPPGPPSPALVDDHVLFSFLNTPAGNFQAPVPKLIPPRWRQMEAAQRQAFFRQALAGYLQAAAQPRDTLLLLVEPEVSVIFFYGIARLLPEAFRKQLSFSTFENDPDRLVTTLAAVRFVDEKTDIRMDRYRRGGFAIHTWLDKHTELTNSSEKYTEFVLQTLLSKSPGQCTEAFRALDEILATFNATGAAGPRDLEELVKCRTTVEQIRRPSVTPLDDTWRKSPKLQLPYVRKAILQDLAVRPLNTRWLDELLKYPPPQYPHLKLVFEIALDQGEAAACLPALEYLVERVSPLEQLDPLFGTAANSDLARALKVRAVQHHVVAHARLPNCEWLWKEKRTASREPLLWKWIQALSDPAATLRSVQPSVPGDCRSLFFVGALTCAKPSAEQQRLLEQLADLISVNELAAVLRELSKQQIHDHGPNLMRMMGDKVRQYLDETTDYPREFATRVAALEAAKLLFYGDNVRSQAVEGLIGFKTALENAAKARQEESGGGWKKYSRGRQAQSERLARKLYEELEKTISTKNAAVDPGVSGARANFAEAVVAQYGVSDLLPNQFKGSISDSLRTLERRWNPRKVSASERLDGLLKQPLLLAGAVFAVIVLLVVSTAAVKLLKGPIVAQKPAEDDAEAGTADGSGSKKSDAPPSQNTGQPDGKGTQQNPGNSATPPPPKPGDGSNPPATQGNDKPDGKDSQPKAAPPPPPKPGDGSDPSAMKDNGQPEAKPKGPSAEGSKNNEPSGTAPAPATPSVKKQPEAAPGKKDGPQETLADEPRQITESPKVKEHTLIAKEPIEGFRMTDATVTKGDLCPIDWKKCGFIVLGLDELPRLLASAATSSEKAGKGTKRNNGESVSGFSPDVAKFEVSQAEEKGGLFTLRYKSQTLPDSLRPKLLDAKATMKDWPSLIRFFLKDSKASYNAIRHANNELLDAQWALQFCVVQLTRHEAGKTDSIFVALQKPLPLKVRSPKKDGDDPLRLAPKNNTAEVGAPSEGFKLSAGEFSQGGEIKADIDYGNDKDYERWSDDLYLGGGQLLEDRTKDGDSGRQFPFGKDVEKHSPTRRWEVPDIVDKLDLRRLGVESIAVYLADDGKSLHLDVAQKVDKVVAEQDQRLKELKTGLSQFQYAYRQVFSKPTATTKDKDKCWDAFGSLAKLVKIEIPIQKVKESKDKLEKASIELKGVEEARRGYDLAVEEQTKTVILAASNEINELNAKAKTRLDIERKAKADIQKNKNELSTTLRRVLRVEATLYRVLKAKIGGEEKEIRVTVVEAALTPASPQPSAVVPPAPVVEDSKPDTQATTATPAK